MRFFLLTTLFLFSACEQFKTASCEVQHQVEKAVASGITAKLECKNELAVKHSLSVAFAKVTNCGVQGMKADTMRALNLCDSLSGMVVDTVVAGVIPADWQCSASATKLELRELVAGLCNGAMK